MPWIRAYVDKKITDKGGGDHSRILDIELKDADFRFGTSGSDKGVVYLEESGRKKLKLKNDEEANNFALLIDGSQANV